jgi:spore maturation protein CgeB
MSSRRFVLLGLSITSSWGNGHATTYRGLSKELVRRGHDVLFLERELPFYVQSRDWKGGALGPSPRVELYASFEDLISRFQVAVREADLVIVGSYVPEGARVGAWVIETARGKTAFYDIDTPVTLAALERGEAEYVSRALVARFDLYLSFTGGPTLDVLARRFGARRPRALYCSVDPEVHFPVDHPAARPRAGVDSPHRWELGYLGTYGADRQAAVERLLLEPARQLGDRRFAVAGAQYPAHIAWPENVDRMEHVPPAEHRAFYGAQRFTLNATRRDMALAGHSPSVRLFEAAACGTPIISDPWPGLEQLFSPGEEILVARSAAEVRDILRHMPEHERRTLGLRARARVLAAHTAAHRAVALEEYTAELLEKRCTAAPRA